MSISQNFPEEGPTLNLNFAGSKTLDPRITFSRTTTGTYMDNSGLIKVAPADSPRFDHRYVNGEIESLGLLVEESRSNIIPYSEDFSQTSWVTFGTASKSSNVATSPDGNFTADSITIPISSGVYDNIAASANTTYTFSSYIKGTPGTTVRILFNFNVSGVTSKTVTVSDVWQRFYVTATSGASDANVSVQYDLGDGNTFYVWGAQVEVGAFPTSYIPTSGSTVTRNPDSVTMTGDNFSDWYNQSEGTFEVSLIENGLGKIGGYPGIMYVDDGTGQNCIGFYISDANDDGLRFEMYDGNVGQGNTPTIGVVSVGEKYNVIGAYASNDMVSTGGGLSVVNPETSVVLPDVNRLIIGILRGGQLNNMLNGTISQLTYYPTRLTNAQLQTLTK